MLHELGHGLNAPHNKEKKSEQETLGTALMGSGNYSYGKSDTFITGATAATFANSQVFSSEVRPDWYTSVDHEITKLRGKFENDKIKISGNFESDYEVTDIVVWHDPYPAGGNQDYDAPAWNTKPVSQDSLHIEMELSEFYKTEGDYQLRIRFYHENGTQQTYSYEYEFQDGIPKIEVINTRDLLSREQWSIIEVSSEEDTGAGSNMLNGNLESVWHTEWKNSLPNHPHHFILDMGETVTIDGLAFANRSNLNGSIKDFHLSASNNNEEWDDLGNYTLDQVQNWQYIDVPENTSYRYYRLETQNSYGGFNYAHLAELAAY